MHKYFILVEDMTAGLWSVIFSSTNFDTAVDMLQYLDRTMPERVCIQKHLVKIHGSHLLN